MSAVLVLRFVILPQKKGASCVQNTKFKYSRFFLIQFDRLPNSIDDFVRIANFFIESFKAVLTINNNLWLELINDKIGISIKMLDPYFEVFHTVFSPNMAPPLIMATPLFWDLEIFHITKVLCWYLYIFIKTPYYDILQTNGALNI